MLRNRSLLFASFIVLILHLQLAEAQQIPFVSEYIARNETFNHLCSERRRSGDDLSALEPVRAKSEAAFRNAHLREVIQALGEAISLLQGKPWDDKARFVSSLTLEANRFVIEPGQELQVSLIRMVPVDESRIFAGSPKVTFEILPAASTGGVNAARAPLHKQPATQLGQVTMTPHMATATKRLNLRDGIYSLVARVEADGKVVTTMSGRLYAIGNFSQRVKSLEAHVAHLKRTGGSDLNLMQALISTPEFRLQRLAVLSQSWTVDPVDPIDELKQIESFLARLDKGVIPFAHQQGELELAYRAADGALVPYRVYIPKTYDGSRPTPLVVALHGALGDERSYFNWTYDPETVKQEAERNGYLIAAPNGRGRLEGYSDAGEEDVIQVINQVRDFFHIDSSRIYLTGHSMGGFGTWKVAADHPDLFAAIAPVAAGSRLPNSTLLPSLGRLKDIPVLVIHGAHDSIVAPEESRELVASAQKAGVSVAYIEVAEAGHMDVVGPSFPAVMGFFSRHRKREMSR